MWSILYTGRVEPSTGLSLGLDIIFLLLYFFPSGAGVAGGVCSNTGIRELGQEVGFGERSSGLTD